MPNHLGPMRVASGACVHAFASDRRRLCFAVVFFDITAGGKPLGRIEMTVSELPTGSCPDRCPLRLLSDLPAPIIPLINHAVAC